MEGQGTSPPNVTIYPPIQAHTASIILCHGLGQSVTLYQAEVYQLSQRLPFVKWILPQAQSRMVSVIGEERPSWFNIWHLPPYPNECDETAASESIAGLEQLIINEIRNGIDQKRIFLVGIGQGAALCLMTALTTLHELAGVASLSGWIPHCFRDHILHSDPYLPIFWAHGNADTEIPLRYARNSIEFLEQRLGMTEDVLCYVEYPGLAHEVEDRVLNDLSHWLLDTLNKSSLS